MATLNPNDLVNAFSEITEELLTEGVQDSLPKMDTFYGRVSNQMMGVKSDGVGRDFKVIHTFRSGIGGTVKWTSALGSQPEQGLNQVIHSEAADSYPGLDENIAPGHFQKTINLARAKGNVFVPIEWLKVNQLSAAITDALAEIMRGAARNVVLSEIQQFYGLSDSSGNVYVGRIGTGSTPTYADGSATNDRITFVFSDGSVRNLYPGALIDIRATGGTVGATRLPAGDRLVVDSVRYIPDDSNDTGGYGEVTAQSLDGTDLSGRSIAADDYIVRLGSVGNGPIGPESWMINTGSVFGVNVGTYQQLQSILPSISGPLTDGILNRYFGRFFQAYGMEDMPDHIVTSMGVTNAYVSNSDGLARFERNGRPFTIAAGFEQGSTPFVFNGMNMQWVNSPSMPSTSDITAANPQGGRLWALKTRDQNLLRYVPPKIPHTGSQEPMPNEVEFAYPTTGPFGIFFPWTSSGAATNFMQAPFDRWIAWVPRVLQAIKMTDLNEEI